MKPTPSGILIVDKPEGPTSHDVVGWVRRALGMKTVGHAGTLDPFASGVLVVLVGEGTKFASYASAEGKTYLTEIALGEETDTLDRDGVAIAGATVPAFTRDDVALAIATMTGRVLQVPPDVSAIKKDGVRNYERARKGERVDPEPRQVVLHRAQLEALTERSLTVRLETGKGYYVRSFGRDLALRLGTRGHLASLRRLKSGRYAIEEALSGEVLKKASQGDVVAQAEVRARLVPLTRSSVPLPCLEVDPPLAADLRMGKKRDASVLPALGEGPHVCFEGEIPIAIVERREGIIRVLRGIVL